MKTGFNEERLAEPRIAEANAILRACVHCGFCAPACPTYAVTGDELEAPRGRIWLIRDLLEREDGPDARAVAHLDHCLECLACMPACPSGVDYRHLVAIAREEIAQRAPRAWSDRLLRAALARVLTNPMRVRGLFRLARSASFLARAMPRRLAAAFRLAAGTFPAPVPGPRAGLHAAPGARKGRVGILAGCVQAALAPGINEALIRLVNRAGMDAVVLDAGLCCGAIEHHLGAGDAARARAKAVIAAVERAQVQGSFDAVVQTAAGCGTLMKDYAHLLRDEPLWAQRAAAVAALTRDASEYLMGRDLPVAGDHPALTVAWQAPCSLANGQGVTREPVELMERAGFRVLVPAEAYCCGSAGTYNALEADMAETLGARKAAALAALKPDVVVSANLGCMTQLRPRVSVPVVHLVELLDWATGGPEPADLTAARPTADALL